MPLPLLHVFWRAPTQAAMDEVARRHRERTHWQSLVRLRSTYQKDPTGFQVLPQAQQRFVAKQFDSLDAAIALDRTLLYFPFDKQLPFHQARFRPDPNAPLGKIITAKARIADCGNRAGKTVSGSVEAVWWAQGTHPYIFTPPPPIWVWYVALDFPHSRDINQPILDPLMPTGTRWNAQARSWTLPNNSEIVLKSQEAGRAKFAGGNIPLVVWDEEGTDPDESKRIYDECIVRTWDQSGQIVMTLTPIEQYAWICDLIQKGLDGDETVDVHNWSGLDNPYVPSDEINNMTFDSEEEEMARKHGALIPLGVRTIFPKKRLHELHAECRVTPFQWGDIQKLQDAQGVWHLQRLGTTDYPTVLRIYEMPTEDDFYLAGIDTGGGVGGNYSVLVMLARRPLRVVCVWRANIVSVDDFAIACMMLGHAYFQHPIDQPATLIAEENNHGHGLLSFMLRCRYPKLWYKPREIESGYSEFPGWRTDVATRPILETAVQMGISENRVQIRDVRIIEECLRYERNPLTGRTGAPRGQHDDCVVALGIGLAVDSLEPLPALITDDNEESNEWDEKQLTMPTVNHHELLAQAKHGTWRKNQPLW